MDLESEAHETQEFTVTLAWFLDKGVSKSELWMKREKKATEA